MTHHYMYAGLRVASELELPEWSVFECADDGADVTFWLNDARASLHELGSSLTRDDCVFPMETVASYHIRGGYEIVVTPQRGAGLREVRLFLLGTAWGVLCYQRGILLLHASVVRDGKGARAFCGPSGAGKSSLAAALIERGYTLVSDDLCRVEFLPDETVWVYPSSPRLKLWDDALRQMQRDAADLQRDYFRADKFHVLLNEKRDAAPMMLDALYLLEWGELGLTRLRGATALQRLVQHATYQAGFLHDMNMYEEHWARMAELVRRVPVFAFRYPREWNAIEQAISLVKSG